MENNVREYPNSCYSLCDDSLKTPPKGYRYLKVGEKLEEGDISYNGDFWNEVSGNCIGIPVTEVMWATCRKFAPPFKTQSTSPAIRTPKVEYVIEHKGYQIYQSDTEEGVKKVLKILIDEHANDPRDLEFYKVTIIKEKLDA